ncbi:hypothetical protein [Candidatus Terasakiella magnetica]|nr:hypothetical protein [Candidatus Terasakiella magnetica]
MSNIQVEQELIEAIKLHCDECPKTDPNDLLHACRHQCTEIDEVVSNVMLLARKNVA